TDGPCRDRGAPARDGGRGRYFFAVTPQYRGISGSTFSAHSSIPPTRFFTFRKPRSRRKFVIRPERTPVLQYTTISSAVLSSLTRPGTCAAGSRTARSRWAISHSIG